MITFDKFYRTIGDLHEGQDAVIYANGENMPCAFFKKCAEYGRPFVLVYDIKSLMFGIVPETFGISFSASMKGYYDDLCNFYDDFRVEIRNREFFTISRVAREDLECLNFDVSNVDDDTMDELASKLGSDYCEQLFWISLDIIADECLGIPRKGDELS